MAFHPPSPHRLLARRLAVAVTMAVSFAVTATTPAYAVSSSIDHVQTADGRVQAVVSLADLPADTRVDPATATVTFDGEDVQATARPLSEDQGQLRRTVVLALDVSDSMKGRKFAAAKQAAGAFLDSAPDNVHVGLVTFAAKVTVAEEPTLDHDRVRAALGSLELSKWTRVHDAVLEALRQGGEDGARSVLLLSDGADTSATPVDEVTTAVAEADVKVDVVALDTTEAATDGLRRIARAGGGTLLQAGDPTALTELFAQEAAALGQQVVVSFEPPAEVAGREGSLEVTLHVDGEPVTDSAFVALPAVEKAEDSQLGATLAPAETGLVVAKEWMILALVAAGLAVMAVVYLTLGSVSREKEDTVARSIEAYTRKGASKLAQGHDSTGDSAGAGSVTQQAVAVAAHVLEGRKGLESALGDRLEGAGLALKPAEWLLLHVGIGFGLGFLGLLLGGGDLVIMLLGLVAGAVLPWVYLALKKTRRLAAFSAQLADTLQLMSGSLSAGLSLAQGVDTVVREGAEPMAGELRRALVETRLGVEIEEALAGVATRMESVDFQWVVMAIRIQRDVGGNLAELLNKVADTIREREYLERQIKTLSAEGRLSVWILAGLPPVFMTYLVLTSPTYIGPMFQSPLGWAMLVVMVVLLVGGTFWMTRLVKVEV